LQWKKQHEITWYWVRINGKLGLIKSNNITSFQNGKEIQNGAVKALDSWEDWHNTIKINEQYLYPIPVVEALDEFSELPCPNPHKGYKNGDRQNHDTEFWVISGCELTFHCCELRTDMLIPDEGLPLRSRIEMEFGEKEDNRNFNPHEATQRLNQVKASGSWC
jgi:hypothetical protein